jgi:type IV pilus assembly protein PilE
MHSGQKPMKSAHTQQGFTLIELMITVAIVAILAAIAYPSYSEQVARSRRGDAQAALLDTAQWIERQYTVSNAYNKQADGTTLIDSLLPALKSNTAANYTLSFGTTTAASTPTVDGFSLRMVPTGGMVNDKCGTFALDNTGAKTISGTTGGASVATCWDR